MLKDAEMEVGQAVVEVEAEVEKDGEAKEHPRTRWAQREGRWFRRRQNEQAP
jgi:hypothetical protein